MANATLYINNSTDELEIGASGSSWKEVASGYDTLIFSSGGAGVADGEDIPTTEELNRAGVQLDDSNPVVVSKYFLSDFSADLLYEIKNAGNQEKRFAFGVSFDGATADEPQLEAWDNDSMNSYADPALGNGTPASSWFKAICTTTNTPSADWTGTPLAGDGVSNVLLLNDGNGALSGADNLYFNFKVIIPGGYDVPASHNPVLVITWTTN